MTRQGVLRDRQGWGLLYLTAGASSVLFVLLLVAALVLDFLAPPPVHGGAATLEFIAANKANYVVEQVLWILPNIFPVLVFAALFVALSPFRKSLPLIALVFGALPWALLLAVPVSSRGSLNLVYLSDRYMLAGTDEERRVYATAAEAIIAENNTPAIVGVLSALGILLMGLAMLTGRRARSRNIWHGSALAPVLWEWSVRCSAMRSPASIGATAFCFGCGSSSQELR